MDSCIGILLFNVSSNIEIMIRYCTIGSYIIRSSNSKIPTTSLFVFFNKVKEYIKRNRDFKYLCSLVNPLTLQLLVTLVSNYGLPKFLRLMCVTCRNFYSRPQICNDLTCSFIILEYFIFIVTSTRCICIDTIIISAFATKFFHNFFIW